MLNDNVGTTNENFERYRARLTKFSSEFELGLFLFIAKRSFLWIILFFIFSCTSAFLYLRYAQPVFQSKSTVQITSNSDAQKILNVGSSYEPENTLAQSIEVLRSKTFIKRVVNKMDLFVSYFNEGTFKANEFYTSSPFSADINIKNPAFYNKKFYISFKDLKGGTIEFGTEKNKTIIPFTVGKWCYNANFDVKIAFNPTQPIETVSENVLKLDKMYFIKFDENTIISEIQSRLDIKLLNELAKTVGITIKDFNPVKAADIANTIASEFQAYDI
ncbi:MAG TPA: Wzz/FepE/Etk N-terminal domain-containing protein, partial [Nitrosopumilaceae archaeon]|nr:Wzz/FepE/Etk N-terminal domain-containing protein [Nitrosopumilaceae archaeon]